MSAVGPVCKPDWALRPSTTPSCPSVHQDWDPGAQHCHHPHARIEFQGTSTTPSCHLRGRIGPWNTSTTPSWPCMQESGARPTVWDPEFPMGPESGQQRSGTTTTLPPSFQNHGESCKLYNMALKAIHSAHRLEIEHPCSWARDQAPLF